MTDFIEGLHRVLRDLATIAGRLEALIAEVDAIGRRVEELEGAARGSGGAPGGSPPAAGPRSCRRPRDPRARALIAEAKRGAHAFAMDWNADGSAMVSVNGGESLRLAPLLATLLAILASGAGSDRGPASGWKTRKEILARLTETAGRKRQPRSLNQLVYRLRNELEAGGVNPYFVQAKPHAGLRLALSPAATVRLDEAPGE